MQAQVGNSLLVAVFLNKLFYQLIFHQTESSN